MIHEQGITPDSEVPMSEEEARALQLRWLPGGIESLDEKDRQRLGDVRDPQLDRAMDLLKGMNLMTQRSPLPENRVAKGTKIALP